MSLLVLFTGVPKIGPSPPASGKVVGTPSAGASFGCCPPRR